MSSPRRAAVLVAALLVIAACGDGTAAETETPDGDTTTPDATTPDTTSGDAGTDGTGIPAVTDTSTTDPAATSTTHPTATSTAHPVREYDFAAIAPIVDGFVAEAGLNGAGLVVVERDDGIVFEHYVGEIDADRVSLVASASKMVTAGVLARLDDEGLLDLDAPVADQVDWDAGDPTITPAQLVSNSSGLVGLGPDPGYPPYLCQFLPAGELEQCGEEIFTTPDDDADVVPPDTEFRYGGGQWQIAGALAEAVSGRSWTELIEETYVEPCGVDSLGYNNHFAQLASGFSYPADFDGDLSLLDATDNPNLEGGAYVDPPDYAALLLLHLRGGRCGDEQVLSPAVLDRLHADRVAAAYDGDAGGPNSGYGMGWWVDRASGRIDDPGLYGAFPWLDLDDGFGAYLVVEATGADGAALADLLFDPVEAAVLAAR